MAEAFGWDLERFLFFGGYPGAAAPRLPRRVRAGGPQTRGRSCMDLPSSELGLRRASGPDGRLVRQAQRGGAAFRARSALLFGSPNAAWGGPECFEVRLPRLLARGCPDQGGETCWTTSPGARKSGASSLGMSSSMTIRIRLRRHFEEPLDLLEGGHSLGARH